MTEIAKRLPTPTPGQLPDSLDDSTIAYWQWDGRWYLHLPGGRFANLRGHDVTEHEDGTITVSPSILITSPGRPQRHGFLRRGKWEPCSDDHAAEVAISSENAHDT